MAAYYMNEGVFDLPDLGFVDRTVHVFEADLPEDDDEIGVIVVRTRIPAEKSLRDLVSAHVTNEAKRLAGFSLIEERETQRAGVPAIEVSSRWRHEGKVVYQKQAHLAAYDMWLLFGVSAPLKDRATCDDALERILTSLRLRDTG